MPQYSYTDLEEKLARAQRERDEALEREKATAEVLRVISRSRGELEPVFKAMLENATRLCEAKFGTLYLPEGGGFRLVAAHDVPSAFTDVQGRVPFNPAPDGALGEVIKTKQTVHLADLAATRAYAERHPLIVDAVEIGGIRTTVAVPLLKDNELTGIIGVYRQDVRPFTDKQVELLTNFAAQAVIAIESTRLLNELRESLQQQTATADVLQVISNSPGELEPVFQTMLENAVRICEANFGTLQLRENDAFRVAAMHNPPPGFAEARRRNPWIYPNAHNALGRVVASKRVVHISDYTQEPAYKRGDPAAVSIVELAGARTLLLVPMVKDDELIGNINIYRQEVRPFTDKQILLLQNFARQAVIAIENARLLNELRRISTAADRDCRRAQGHQPLDFRFAGRPGHADQVSRPALRGGSCRRCHCPCKGWHPPVRDGLPLSARDRRIFQVHLVSAGAWKHCRADTFGRLHCSRARHRG